MGLKSFAEQSIALPDTEAMLFIDNDEAQTGKLHRIFNQRMGPHQNMQSPIGEIGQHAASIGTGRGTGQEFDGDLQRRQPPAEGAVMLLGKDLRRRHQSALPTSIDSVQKRSDSDDGFAAAHVALHQSGHGFGFAEISLDFGQNTLLSAGEFEGKLVEEPPHKTVAHAHPVEDRSMALAMGVTALHQPELKQQELVKNETTASLLKGIGAVGSVDALDRLTSTDQAECLTPFKREGFGRTRGCGQNRLDKTAKTVCREPVRQGINGQKTADLSGTDRTVGALQDLDQRILKTKPIGAGLDQAADGHRGADGILARLGVQSRGAAEALAS